MSEKIPLTIKARKAPLTMTDYCCAQLEEGVSPLLGTFTGGDEGVVHMHGQRHMAPLHQLPHTQ